MEERNLSKKPIILNEQRKRQLSQDEMIGELKKAFDFDLSEDDWRWVSDLFHVKTYYEDEMVFRRGDFNDVMYIILKGELLLFAGSQKTGGEVDIAVLHKGDTLGESCMTHTPYTLNCRAAQFTELLGIYVEDFQKLVTSNPDLGVKFYQQILSKVIGKLRNNNLQSISRAGGTVNDSFIDDGEE
jgi:CRP-like cAMP-binding protein